MTRRMQHYDVASWQPGLVVAAIGVVVILAGIVSQVIQLVVSIRDREKLRVTADPWNGRTLEWATASPPPPWNFAVLPQVTSIDAFWRAKQDRRAHQAASPREKKFEPIEIPKSSATGFVTAFFAVLFGFAMIWHIWWMAGLGILGAFLTMLAFAFREEEEIEIPVEQIARLEMVNPSEIAL
jgi:cytochrome o ubiquinol oxidase subunit 1